MSNFPFSREERNFGGKGACEGPCHSKLGKLDEKLWPLVSLSTLNAPPNPAQVGCILKKPLIYCQAQRARVSRLQRRQAPVVAVGG